MLSKIWSNERWRGLFAGNGANCIRVLPFSALVCLAYYNMAKVSEILILITLYVTTRNFTIQVMKFGDTRLLNDVLFWAFLLTLGTHAQQGLQYSVCLSVCPSVTTFSATTRNKQANKRHQRVQCYTGFSLKMVIFLKILRSKVNEPIAN